MGNFRDLKVWQKARDLAVYIYRLTDQGIFSKDFGLKRSDSQSSRICAI